MALVFEAGFTGAHIADQSFTIEERNPIGGALIDSDSVSLASIDTSLTFSHTGFGDYLGEDIYGRERFPAFSEYLNTVIGLLGTSGYLCSYNSTTRQYEFTANSGNAVAFSGSSAVVGLYSGSLSVPDYILVASGHIAGNPKDFELQGNDYVHRTEGGLQYHATGLGKTVVCDLQLRMESKALMYKAFTSGVTLTDRYMEVEELYEHCRGRLPFRMDHDVLGTSIHWLRVPTFDPEPTAEDRDDMFDIRMETFVARLASVSV